MYDVLYETVSMILLLMLIVLGNLITAALLKWARQHDKRKQQQPPTCPRLTRPTSNSRVVCGKPLAAHADSDGWGVCPVHGLIRTTL